jgi:formylglycine-generating enzyme required for sulfatase activity
VVNVAGNSKWTVLCNALHPSDRAQHPMNCVSWQQARGYCAWAGGKRLPTEQEWHYAAFATGSGGARRFAWGNDEPVANQVNLCGPECSSELVSEGLLEDITPIAGFSDPHPTTALVGSAGRDVTADGIEDMGGNVSEWTSSRDDGNAWVRGASWLVTTADDTSSRGRWLLPKTNRRPNVGFRCAR